MLGSLQYSTETLGICFVAGAALTLCALRQVGVGKAKRKKTREELSDQRPKVVVITGCDTGFGKLMAEAWSDRNKCPINAIVVALTLREESVKMFGAYNEAHKEDPDFSPVVAIRCDVTSADDVAAAKTQIETLLLDKDAVLYAIVNNAGIVSPGDFVFYNDLDIPRKIMDVNFFGQLAITQALLPAMMSTSNAVGGKIINMSSVCGTFPGVSNSLYGASKSAIESWSAAIRAELKPFNIQVTAIRPDQTATDIQNQYTDLFNRNFEKAPAKIQHLYGGSMFLKKFAEIGESLGLNDVSKMTPPSETVDSITEVLVSSEKLKTYYWVGRNVNLFKIFTLLPTQVLLDLLASTKATPLNAPGKPTLSVG